MDIRAGAIAQAFYGEIPAEIKPAVRERLPSGVIAVVERFNDRFQYA